MGTNERKREKREKNVAEKYGRQAAKKWKTFYSGNNCFAGSCVLIRFYGAKMLQRKIFFVRLSFPSAPVSGQRQSFPKTVIKYWRLVIIIYKL